MKLRDIYLQAAERVAEKADFSCVAIAEVCKQVRHSCPASTKFRAAMGFGPERVESWHDEFIVAISNHCWDAGQEPADFRVLLLCMMAAACEDL